MKKILKPGANCQGIYEVDETGLLVDARDYYRAFYHAARQARRYILLAGWQFDSRVLLLRGKDAREAEGDPRFLPFLKSLCEKNPDLMIRILAWDFSILFSMEREWFQERIFNDWAGSRNLTFRFDSSHAIGASHHQKFVVVDGVLAFVGGMDICARRWDDRPHREENPLRLDPAGSSYEPFHDVQSYHIGPLAEELARLFSLRWQEGGGEDLVLPPPGRGNFKIEGGLPIAAHRTALSRTRARTILPPGDPVQEIRALYRDAIHAAEEFIYMENQYFTSRAVYRALLERMQDRRRAGLQIVIFLPRSPKALKEEVSLFQAQTQILRSLKKAAREKGHSLGLYCPSSSRGKRSDSTYIHSKVLLVDDRFLSVGSANTTNRSMGLDSELNASWEAGSEKDSRFLRSLRRIRVNLLQEQTRPSLRERRQLGRREGLVDFLDRLAAADERPFHILPLEEDGPGPEWLEQLKEALPIDPEKAFIEEDIFEMLSNDRTGLLSNGISMLNHWLSDRGGNSKSLPFLTGDAGARMVKPPRSLHPLAWVVIFSLLLGMVILWILFHAN